MSFIRGELGKCPAGHDVLFLGNENLVQERCEECDKKTKSKAKLVIKPIIEHHITGPYADGSYVIDGIYACSSNTYLNFGRGKNIPKYLSNDLTTGQINESLCIAIYESNPNFWLTKNIMGPNDLCSCFLAIGYVSYPRIRQNPEDVYINKMGLKFNFNLLVHNIPKEDAAATTQLYSNENKSCNSWDTKLLHIKLTDGKYSKI